MGMKNIMLRKNLCGFNIFFYLTTILLQAVAWLVQFCRVTSRFHHYCSLCHYSGWHNPKKKHIGRWLSMWLLLLK